MPAVEIPSPAGHSHMFRRLAYAAGWWLALFVLYLLLAGKAEGEEALAGLVLAVPAAVAMIAVREAGRLHYRPRWRWLGKLGRLPGKVVKDCAIVAAALWRALVRREKVEGVFRTIPFDPGGEDAESAARRALVVAGVCVAPNTFVVALEEERGLILVHQLVPSAQPPGGGDREWPL